MIYSIILFILLPSHWNSSGLSIRNVALTIKLIFSMVLHEPVVICVYNQLQVSGHLYWNKCKNIIVEDLELFDKPTNDGTLIVTFK